MDAWWPLSSGVRSSKGGSPGPACLYLGLYGSSRPKSSLEENALVLSRLTWGQGIHICPKRTSDLSSQFLPGPLFFLVQRLSHTDCCRVGLTTPGRPAEVGGRGRSVSPMVSVTPKLSSVASHFSAGTLVKPLSLGQVTVLVSSVLSVLATGENWLTVTKAP